MNSMWISKVLRTKLGNSWEFVNSKRLHREASIPIYERHELADWIETNIHILDPQQYLSQLRQRCTQVSQFLLSCPSANSYPLLETEDSQILQDSVKWCLENENQIADYEGQSQVVEQHLYDDREKFTTLTETTKNLYYYQVGFVKELCCSLNSYKNHFCYVQEIEIYPYLVQLLSDLMILVKGYFKHNLDLWEYQRKRFLIGFNYDTTQLSVINSDAYTFRVVLRELMEIIGDQDFPGTIAGKTLAFHIGDLQQDLLQMSIYIEDKPVISAGNNVISSELFNRQVLWSDPFNISESCFQFPLRIGFFGISGQEFEPSDSNIYLEAKIKLMPNKLASSSSKKNLLADASMFGKVTGNKFPVKDEGKKSLPKKFKSKNSLTKPRSRFTKSPGSLLKNSSHVKEPSLCECVKDCFGNHLIILMDKFMLEKSESRRWNSQGKLVTDQLAHIVLVGWIVIDGREFKIHKLSLPHVVTTHISQSCKAWSTILENYGFIKFPQIFSEPSKSVKWKELLDVISKFYSMKTELSLDHSQLEHISRRSNYSPDEEVELQTFFKQQTFPDVVQVKGGLKKFTFWDWFYGTIKLIESMKNCHQSKPEGEKWIRDMDKYFMGFISQENAEEILRRENKAKMFLLRFSDSTASAISVVVSLTAESPRSVMPFTLNHLPLSSRIMDMVDAEFLYPANIHKSLVFGTNQIPVQSDPHVANSVIRRQYYPLYRNLMVEDENLVLERNWTMESESTAQDVFQWGAWGFQFNTGTYANLPQ